MARHPEEGHPIVVQEKKRDNTRLVLLGIVIGFCVCLCLCIGIIMVAGEPLDLHRRLSMPSSYLQIVLVLVPATAKEDDPTTATATTPTSTMPPATTYHCPKAEARFRMLRERQGLQ